MGSILYFFPLGVFLLFPVTFILTYCIAVLLKHTEPEFPYISDTGAVSPESCIFGQALNFGSFLLICTLYIRYRQILEFYESHLAESQIHKLNKASLIVGCLSAFGISIVANFQESNVVSVHLCGALLTFAGGVVYLILQAKLSYKTRPLINSLRMARLRLFLAVIASILFVIGLSCSIVAYFQFHGTNRRKWNPSDGGWIFHVISTGSEWLCAASFNIFMLTLITEFKGLSMGPPQLYLTIENLTASQYILNQEPDDSDIGQSRISRNRLLVY